MLTNKKRSIRFYRIIFTIFCMLKTIKTQANNFFTAQNQYGLLISCNPVISSSPEHMRPSQTGYYRSDGDDTFLLGEAISKIVHGSEFTHNATKIWESCIHLMQPTLDNRGGDVKSCQCILNMRKVLNYVKVKNPNNRFVEGYIAKWYEDFDKKKCWELSKPISGCAVEQTLQTGEIHCRQYYIQKSGEIRVEIIDTPVEGGPTFPIEV